MNNHIVIMAGGIGSRLWPASTPSMPKQFIDILGVGKSLLQLTVERFLALAPIENFWVVTSSRYEGMVREQIPGIPAGQILQEPEARNTAPCISYACRKIRLRHPDANIVVTPSDALVLEKEKFAGVISEALSYTAGEKAIVTVGIIPSRPETGYGYIHSADAVPGKVSPVSEFREKPDLATAKAYLADGGYFWNAGIFVFSVQTMLSELRSYAPSIESVIDGLEPSLWTASENAALQEYFPRCEKISIDYAVMEKSSLIHVIASDLGWSDLGSWGSVKTHIPSDGEGNAVVGARVRLPDTSNSIVYAPLGKTVVAEGLDGYIIADTPDRLLICRLSDEQHIKEYSEGL